MTTPEKYIPENRDWREKDYLYQQYWGEMNSATEIAEENGVGQSAVLRRMKELGIPRRPQRYWHGNAVSPFAGFYGRQPVPTNQGSNATEKIDDWEPDWSEYGV
jgi:hypothetical protein